VDVGKLSHLYKGASREGLYGLGFTICGLLDDIAVDRTDIAAKIKARYFDLVIFGSVHRCRDYFDDVLAAYPASQIVFIDGEDQPLYLLDLPPYGHYFKREIYVPQERRLLPISFAIPEEKIAKHSVKTRLMASSDPMSTVYKFKDEASYYADYQSALFGKTTKKAGWDCLRHYEIMANGCCPYFQNLEHCPDLIMTKFPKAELMVAKTVLEYKGFSFFETEAGFDLWRRLMERIHATLQQYLTTTALAKYVLDAAKG